MLDVDDRLHRVDDPVVDDGVDGQRDVVPGDGALRGDAHHDGLHGHLPHPVDERDEQPKTGLAKARQQPAEPQDDALLVLLYKTNAGAEQDEEDDEDRNDDGSDHDESQQRAVDEAEAETLGTWMARNVSARKTGRAPVVTQVPVGSRSHGVRELAAFADQPSVGGPAILVAIAQQP